MQEISILQEQVEKWIKTVGVRYFNELTNMAILTEEVGEVARIIARRYGEQSEKESDKDKDLGEELADVLFVTLCLANQTGTNLQAAFEKKLILKTLRDETRHQNNIKLMNTVPHSEMLEGQTVEITGSKSESNRLLILQKLFGNVTLKNISNSEDTTLLANALQSTDSTKDIHHAGTAMRFLTSFYAIQEGEEILLTGSDRMKQRPIKPLVDALLQLDAEIEYLENDGFPPLRITGKRLVKNEVTIPANISSQFISSLMLIGSQLLNGLKINLEGTITSQPYLLMTIQLLNQMGIRAVLVRNEIQIPFTPEIKPFDYTVESDWSSASYFYSLAAIGRKSIILKNYKTKSLQGDSRIAEIYDEYFGLKTEWISETAIRLVPLADFDDPGQIKLEMNSCPDLAQTVCVTATALKIPFELTGLHTLKVKETDRLVALQNELRKIGLITEITDNSIRSLKEEPLQAKIRIATYHDHRMAMAFAPFALIHELEFDDPQVVEKSYPDFWKDFYSVVRRISGASTSDNRYPTNQE